MTTMLYRWPLDQVPLCLDPTAPVHHHRPRFQFSLSPHRTPHTTLSPHHTTPDHITHHTPHHNATTVTKCERFARQLFLFCLTSFIHLSVLLDQRSSQLRESWKHLRAVTLKGRIHESNISQIPTFENTQWRKAAQTEFMRAISVKWSAALNSNSLAHPNIRSCNSNFQKKILKLF